MSNENAVMVVNQCPIQDTENNRKMALSLNAEAMETFKKFLRLEEVSDKTVIQYHSQIKDFLSWCYENHIDVVTATYQDILEYRNYLTAKDYAKTMVINGKGDMVRKIGIPDFQFKYVLNLLATIPQSPEAFLFVNTSNKKGTSPNLSTRGLRLLIDTLMTKANIKKAGSSSHSLRHGCAMALYRHGVPIEKISVQLGHESIKTTMIYVNVADTIEKPVSSVLDCLLV